MHFNVKFRARGFKYLSESTDFDIIITDPKMLVGLKSIEMDLDLNQLPKEAKTGGRIFYQLELIAGDEHVSD